MSDGFKNLETDILLSMLKKTKKKATMKMLC